MIGEVGRIDSGIELGMLEFEVSRHQDGRRQRTANVREHDRNVIGGDHEKRNSAVLKLCSRDCSRPPSRTAQLPCQGLPCLPRTSRLVCFRSIRSLIQGLQHPHSSPAYPISCSFEIVLFPLISHWTIPQRACSCLLHAVDLISRKPSSAFI